MQVFFCGGEGVQLAQEVHSPSGRLFLGEDIFNN